MVIENLESAGMPDFRFDCGDFGETWCRLIALSGRGIERLEAECGAGVVARTISKSAGPELVARLESEGYRIVDKYWRYQGR